MGWQRKRSSLALARKRKSVILLPRRGTNKRSSAARQTIRNEKEEGITMANEKNGTGINWNRVALRDDHGSIDLDATLALCTDEINLHIEAEVSSDDLAGAVTAALSHLTQGGVAQKASTDLNGLSVKALSLLGDIPAGATTMVQERIKDFIRGESRRFVESNGANGLCFLGRGRGRGVNVSTAKFVEEYRAAQAKKTAAQ